MNRFFPSLFFVGGLIMLIVGVLAGLAASLFYVSPDWIKEIIPFNQLRPLHVVSVVCWIILIATGSVYHYVKKELGSIYSNKLAFLHLGIFCIAGVALFASLASGKMGGREYLVFPQWLMIPILVAWIIFGVNYFKSILKNVKNWPVYYWMWGTGIVFMIFHLTESNLWFFHFIREHFIKDMTIQWKSYGSFVGSWNMLIYGISIYLMARIKQDDSIGRGKLAFFFYFLGLTNLMFGWAHHTYLLPTEPWIRIVAYIVSMTEWIILIKMIYSWSKSLKKEKETFSIAYKFLLMSELWVFLNLLMALLMSIPVLNYFSHGTHITVAHSMGTTIGINTMILFASLSFIIEKNQLLVNTKRVLFYNQLINWSLGGFWITLILMGVKKAIWLQNHSDLSIQVLHSDSTYYYVFFVLFGGLLCIGLAFLAIQYLRAFGLHIRYIMYPKKIQEMIDQNILVE